MPGAVKNLSFQAVHIGLILSAHFGVLNVAYDDFLMEMTSEYTFPLSVLLSAFVLSVSLPLASLVFRTPNVRKDLLLYSIITALFLFLLYGAFFTGQTYKIAASTGLFIAVAALIAFCRSQKTETIRKNLQRGLTAALFLTLPICLYVKPQTVSDAASYLENTRISPTESRFKVETSMIDTTFYNVHLTRYFLQTPMRAELIEGEDPSHFSALDDKNFLLITRLGGIYHLALKPREGALDEDLYAKKLPAVFPINFREFESASENENIIESWFRVNDLYIDVENEVRVLYVSHHFWNVEKECFTLRISKLVGDVSILLEGEPAPSWQTLYETVPCFPWLKPNKPFVGNQAGGRVVGLDEHFLLFSVGDHGFEGNRTAENYPQDPDASYGKILKINRRTGQAEPFSWGHRNPQGLYHAPDGSVWETEHGPRGGDELNKIEKGKNYGWPHVVYGTNYDGSRVWPLSPHQNRHDGYEQPAFAWTPSVGVSNLIRVEQDLFPAWKGNLLVGSLHVAKTLFRLQLHENRVIYSEPIRVNHAVRDLTETPNGEIFIWSGFQEMLRLRPANILPRKDETIAEAGQRLFFKCTGCHSVNPGAPHGIGPNLHDIYNARIAAKAGYHYSPGLQAKSSEKWTRENLSLFLEDPEAFAPGTPMQIKTPDAGERRALLHYLENH